LAILAALQCGYAYSQKIEIKGLRLGMTTEEAEAKVGPMPLLNFTIAGVPGKYADSSPDFHDGKLDSFAFYFDSAHFDDVFAAVKSKYPALRCVKSKVVNALGASFTQLDCHLRDKTGDLTLTRFINDINTSGLSLRSDRDYKEWAKSKKSRERDF
jgi:hypothetical protein